MERNSSTLELQHFVDVRKLLRSPKRELLTVLRALQDWETAEPQEVHVTQISGAMTNLIYRCHYTPSDHYVLARIFGTSGALFDRQDEQRIFAALAHAGLGPKLLANFGNGRLEEFLLDQSITAAQMRTPPVAACVAAAMATFSFAQLTKLPQRDLSKPICWGRLRDWATSAQELYSPDELKAEGLGDVFAEIGSLEAKLGPIGADWIGFCHNDTQYGNMLLHTASRSQPELAPPESIRRSDHHSRASDGRSQNSQEAIAVQAAQAEIPELKLLSINTSSRPAFSIEEGVDVACDRSDAWGFDKPSDVEESQGSSPRKHPRGLSVWQDRDEEPQAASQDAPRPSTDPRLSVRLIDYEYAGVNPVAYDIANHWCEYAADYHGAEPHRLDFSRLPTGEQQTQFTRAYVAAALALRRAEQDEVLPSRADSATHSLAAAAAVRAPSGHDDASSERDVNALAEKLRHAAVAYLPVSHLQWGIWGLIQARVSEVPSFNFTEYGRQRLWQYRALLPCL